ncbi:MAG: type II toxin-antitoxin system RelB/DinJ family antitoxin [Deferribacteraceae bacterium]|jgi:DNA-damage-inducible protein J|nr:type II toxin-antitoxin system RelB/DinJ family antitoxin [Deferribacteraceae bacterium]
MANVTNLNIEIDLELKAKADQLFNEMGMNLTTAVNVFVRQAVLEQAMPFTIHSVVPNTRIGKSSQERQAAMQEIRELLTGMDDVDLDQMKAERRATKFERND